MLPTHPYIIHVLCYGYVERVVHLQASTIAIYSIKSCSSTVITGDQMNQVFFIQAYHNHTYHFTVSYVMIGGHLWLLGSRHSVATMCSGLMNRVSVS